MNYYYSKTISNTFDETVEKLRNVLPLEGFGVVTEMNLTAKFKEKLNIDYRPYLILGTCNPKYAYEGLKVENKLGTILPCNFMVQKIDDSTTEIAAINPEVAMQSINNTELLLIAKEIGEKIKRILDAV
jgi:uncharacterized protein (DUF302 family)